MDERRTPLRYFEDDADAIFLRSLRQKFAAGAAAAAVGLEFLPSGAGVAWVCAGVVALCVLTWIVLTVRLRRLRV